MFNLRLIFMGTPTFAVPSLELLLHHGYDIAAVVTAPDKPQGRGQRISSSPIKRVAIVHGLPILQPTDLMAPDFLTTLHKYQANLQVVVAFRMLPRAVWAMPTFGTFNLHASLLPQYRGAAPINWALMHGEQETGVTTFFLEEAMDTGHILFQKKIDISDQDTAGTLHERLKHQGAQIVLNTVQAIEQGNYTTRRQSSIPSHLLRKAPKLYQKDCQINWEQDATTILNFIRGLAPHPGAWTSHQGNRIKILVARQVEAPNLKPGAIQSDGKHYLHVGTQSRVLAIDKLQQAGKKLMDTPTFLRGYRPAMHTEFC